MFPSSFSAHLALLILSVWMPLAVALLTPPQPGQDINDKISPRVFIISMFEPEAQIWYDRFSESGLGNLTSQSIPLPGLSVVYPQVFCTADGIICQATMCEGEINAAASMMALVLSGRFDLRSTYFLLAGIAGVNPHHATLGSVAFSRYAVQVALQYEIDPRSLPKEWTTGYIAFGRDVPFEYPSIIYGTEVFEVSLALRDAAYDWASNASLSDDEHAQEYRSKYSGMGDSFAPAAEPPSVVRCDTATSDVYYSGTMLSEAFEQTVSVWTNGTGEYCMSAQEDNATLGVLLRAAVSGLVDFSRIVIMRTGSNFDRPPSSVSDLDHLTHTEQNGFHIAVDNLYNAGIAVVQGILEEWNCTFSQGLEPTNYIGDIFGSLGGEPDFGPGSITGGSPAPASGSEQDAEDDQTDASNMIEMVRPVRRRRKVRGTSFIRADAGPAEAECV